ncbi:hypothetical protein GCM10009549_28130 [Streptomyces thermoalcalitolerans]|uniref:Transposase IS701-like DDE domain-containing protein n=1 Tax=Streptomyces thermoalcalitolerans TaxID=65605 RepID=A0ABN1NR00_9ACTN
MPFRWVTGDEIYGQDPVLRGWLAERQLSYVPTIGCGPRGQNARTISAILPKDAWEIRSAGNSAHGLREYAWVMVPLTGDHSDFENALLIRRSLASSERAYYCSRSCCDRLWGRSLSRVWVGTSRLMRCVAGQPGWMLCMPGSAGISAGRSHTNGRESTCAGCSRRWSAGTAGHWPSRPVKCAPTPLANYRSLLDLMERTALPPDASQDLIRSIAREL